MMTLLSNGLTLLLLKTERCQPRLWLRLIISPWEVLLPYEKVKILFPQQLKIFHLC